MEEMLTLTPRRALALIRGALAGAGTSHDNLGYLSEAILDTELSGLAGHGFYWLQYYCAHVESGKVDGRARPRVTKLSPVAFRVDAGNGFAHPAIEKGFARLIPAARRNGIAGLAVHHSYSGATLGFHTGYLARQGLVAFGFTNATPAIAPPGGSRPVIGTNPISFAVPARHGKIAFLIDQSASAVTWTAVKRAAEEGRDIPLGWALDAAGKPTTDPNEGLAGSMAAAGGYKGFGIGLVVEVMCAAMTGARLGPQMGSFMADDGKPVGCGQFFIALSPEGFSGGAFDRTIRTLVASIRVQPGARLPNARRAETQARLRREGIPIERSIHDRLAHFAAKAGSGAGRRS
jgi:(2R)-3-sulfolactate dehydrogenase (NADP+)